MKPDESLSAASRLCTECGLCCNGVMFYMVCLQPGDSAGELSALGLRVQRKKRQHRFSQPCTAHCGAGCSIYAQRPERCRLFECQQLKRVATGKISEAAALEAIHWVKARVAAIEELLYRSGTTDPRRPLARRCHKILATPLDDPDDAAAVALRQELTRALEDLEEKLDRDFRNQPAMSRDSYKPGE